MYHRILIPLDGSPLGESALDVAVPLARCMDAALVLLSVPDHPMLEYYVDQPIVLADLRVRDAERASAYLEAVATRLRATVARVETRIAEGAVADAILMTARSEDADLIVMATHGRSGMGRFLLGSVADHVTRRVSIPVMLIRPGPNKPG